MPAKPCCRTCRWWTYRYFGVAGVFRDWPVCEKHVRFFPDAEHCPAWEREPGADDDE